MSSTSTTPDQPIPPERWLWQELAQLLAPAALAALHTRYVDHRRSYTSVMAERRRQKLRQRLIAQRDAAQRRGDTDDRDRLQRQIDRVMARRGQLQPAGESEAA